jgi:hypothetical protein
MYPLPCTRNDGKASYYCAVVWVQNPDDIAKEGVLCLEEIPDRPPAAWHFVDPGTADLSHPYQMPLTCTCLLPWDSAPTLDSDTELTYLPPGLLDSPPHPHPIHPYQMPLTCSAFAPPSSLHLWPRSSLPRASLPLTREPPLPRPCAAANALQPNLPLVPCLRNGRVTQN